MLLFHQKYLPIDGSIQLISDDRIYWSIQKRFHRIETFRFSPSMFHEHAH